ncbi:diphthamide biosynthesis protein 2 [Cryptococcus neoformans C23]|uniref:2-(3-amino-3-carboxypropyl)histidine synthase subunit 2 n=1 Tax=Cryptococcus neoformans (strain H99 / ATCC 208821 / CBS 10515 / FGSC 9487) TaxID=235443 RepID=J9W0H9_CRYN9|nr:diphthamide biosynthesis protein 2 [Cryptococcus neoformans var. grubii H99]AUB28597.1 diphthamide biosynthesis protein 2 [Cryptococcus neoformans var. grubii]OWZ27256.1 diphthamide biosynthesis protein 2 [Cryptococcus neoformans var. grubii AD2-60a]OWZ39219.1 diphthamide biosynthesis protein 2 [Cryptococcus neoformans var. grubii C23]OXC81411.1 diphthamide biosynthesis protein 2 [Cryptococcus neoformans var. grubii AD1-7a]OXG27078.1 diphthamide biosynthesis protein 2 [Cryptococcus neoforma|eukprot:XP_012053213.1 diphthamide biosynthesis protein 2 [Cryptococcus neoformans var. grubii H99]
MSDAFSTPADHALSHPELEEILENAQAGPSSMGDGAEGMSIEEAFEVSETVRRVLESGYKTIGLQFPDELLPSSVSVYRAIQTRIAHTGAQAYVLADSTYGNCCPDVLSCLHLPADFLVHYGHACLTPTDALPVHYVFPRQKLDVKQAMGSLLAASKKELDDDGKKGIVVVWDVSYDWLTNDIRDTFSQESSLPISFASIQKPTLAPQKGLKDEKGKASALRSVEPPQGLEMNDCVLWYIGEEGRSCMNLQMTHVNNPLFVYSPSSQSVSPLNRTTSRLLSRRLFALHQALSADVFGLIVSNIGLASSKPLLAQLREDLKRAKKKSYTLSVGRLNPAKLANFAEIECFVLVGCAEGGVVDSKDFLRPIITPWELELALQGPEHVWAPENWTLDLGTVLEYAQEREIKTKQASSTTDSDDDSLEFSLITGTMRTKKRFGFGNSTHTLDSNNLLEDGVQDLTLRNQNFSLSKLESAGSTFLASREFQGLEPRYGMDEPSVLEQGRSGVARGYTEEK